MQPVSDADIVGVVKILDFAKIARPVARHSLHDAACLYYSDEMADQGCGRAP